MPTRSPRLPPLRALQVFEAAARHMSFTRAAAELCVTQTAVSHQIRNLEEWFGQPLFVRLNPGLGLTDLGRRYLPAVHAAFGRLAEATHALDDFEELLTVTIIPSLARCWLVPRLPRLRAVRPDLDVRVHAGTDLADLAHGEADVGIRFGPGPYPGLHTTLLAREHHFPVCSPSVQQGPPRVTRLHDLRSCTLLHDEHRPGEPIPSWRDWLEATGAPDTDANRGPRFADASMMVQAAVAGQGVALGRSLLVADDLAAGRLVRPFGPALPSGFAYWLVCSPTIAGTAKVRAFRDWIVAETAATEAALDLKLG